MMGVPPLTASPRCPICGVNVPHNHTLLERALWRELETERNLHKQQVMARRRELRDALAGLTKTLNALQPKEPNK